MSDDATTAVDRESHWEDIWSRKDEREVSWFEAQPGPSLDLIRATGVASHAAVLDVGGGASRLVDGLLDAGFRDIAILDISQAALAASRARLGPRAAAVQWIVADVTTWRPAPAYDIWHDRAVFHFLLSAEDRAAYAERVAQAVRPGGHVIIGTFAPDGPQRCSGLPVVRHDSASLGAMLGPSFRPMESRDHAHHTPAGAVQLFQFSRFARLNPALGTPAQAALLR